jgi:hypothetical protein
MCWHLPLPARSRTPPSLFVQSVTELPSDSEEVGPRGDSNEKRQSRVWKIEETSSQRQEDIDAGVPSDEQLLAMKLCGKRDESPRSIQWSTGVRGQGVTLVKQCIVVSEQSWPDRSLGESQRVDIGGGSQETGSVAVRGIDRTGPSAPFPPCLPPSRRSPQSLRRSGGSNMLLLLCSQTVSSTS